MRIVQTHTVTANGGVVKRYLSLEKAQAHLDELKAADQYGKVGFSPHRIETAYTLEVNMGGTLMHFALTLMHVEE